MKTSLYVFVWIYVLISHEYILHRGITGSYDNSLLNFMRNCQTLFQRCCHILHFYWQFISVPIFPYSCQHLLLFGFLIIGILVDVKRYLIGDLRYILLMDNNMEHLFMFVGHVYMSLEKYLFKSYVHFLIFLPVYYWVVSALYIILIGILFFKIYLIYLFMAALDLCCCARAFSSCGERGLLFVVVHGLLIAVASPAAEHRL